MRVLFITATVSLLMAVNLPTQAGINIDTEAQIAFLTGVEHFKAQRYNAAAAAFRKANELKPNWKIQYNIGQCEAAAKRYGLALEAFEQYLAKGGDDISVERQKDIMSEVDRLRRMVGLLEIKGQAGDVIFINEMERGPLPGAARLRVPMGQIALRVEREESIVLEKTIEIFGARNTTIEVPMASPKGEKKYEIATPKQVDKKPDTKKLEPAPAKPTPNGKVGLLIGGIVTGAAGLAGIGLGGYFSYLYNDDVDTANTYKNSYNNPDTRRDTDAENYNKYKDNLSKDTAGAMVFYATGGALLATSIVLTAIYFKKRKEKLSFPVSLVPLPSGLSVQF